MMTLDEAKGIVKEWVGRTAEHRVVLALFICDGEEDTEVGTGCEDFLNEVLGEKAEALFPEEFAEPED